MIVVRFWTNFLKINIFFQNHFKKSSSILLTILFHSYHFYQIFNLIYSNFEAYFFLEQNVQVFLDLAKLRLEFKSHKTLDTVMGGESSRESSPVGSPSREKVRNLGTPVGLL